jgi:negative regulator of sigma E activity
MTRDELEFSISQYLDGTLAEAERDALETRLGSDAQARAIYAEYESLQRAMIAAPLPAVNWDKFAESISAAVADEEAPATSYKISAWFQPVRLAIAASVALVVGGLVFMVSRNGENNSTGPNVAQTPISIVKVDSAESTPVSTPVSVAIIPPSSTAERPSVVRYAESVVQRPSKALIVSAAPAGQDSSQTPF